MAYIPIFFCLRVVHIWSFNPHWCDACLFSSPCPTASTCAVEACLYTLKFIVVVEAYFLPGVFSVEIGGEENKADRLCWAPKDICVNNKRIVFIFVEVYLEYFLVSCSKYLKDYNVLGGFEAAA